MIAVIINPVSGGARRDAARLRAEMATAVLVRHGKTGEVFVTERRGHARELAAAAMARNATQVVAWGGDGTINEVASVVAFSPATLGIVPSGSGNGLARAIGVDHRPEHALAAAVEGRPRPIDVGEIGGRLFVSVAGVGFDAHVASSFDKRGTIGRGLVGYMRVTARELMAYRPGVYSIDGRPDCSALLVTLANASQFGNGACIAPGAKVDDGLLDLVVFEERSRLRTICSLPRLFNGTVATLGGVSIRRIERAAIESATPMVFHVDGEPVQGGTRLEARIHPGGLLVSS